MTPGFVLIMPGHPELAIGIAEEALHTALLSQRLFKGDAHTQFRLMAADPVVSVVSCAVLEWPICTRSALALKIISCAPIRRYTGDRRSDHYPSAV